MVQNGSGSQTYDGGEGTDTYKIDFSVFSIDPSRVIEVNMITGYQVYRVIQIFQIPSLILRTSIYLLQQMRS